MCEGASSTGADFAAALRRWSEIFGAYPQSIYTDNGREFLNSTIWEMCLDEQIKHYRTVADVHKSNGFIERANRSLRNIIERLTSVPASRMDALDADVVVSD